MIVINVGRIKLVFFTLLENQDYLELPGFSMNAQIRIRKEKRIAPDLKTGPYQLWVYVALFGIRGNVIGINYYLKANNQSLA